MRLEGRSRATAGTAQKSSADERITCRREAPKHVLTRAIEWAPVRSETRMLYCGSF
jgi:hypothetical protein